MGQFGGATGQVPAFIEPLLKARYSADDIERILDGYASARSTTLRANPLRSSSEEVAQALTMASLPFSRVTWYSDAFVLEAGSDAAVRDLPLFEQGAFYLQSLSAMLPPLAMRLAPGLDVLDMCAAPGGKTTQIAALTDGAAHITACELNGPRAERLEFNLERQGARNVVVMRQDARQLDDFFSFDRILLDAPCTGSGTVSLDDPRVHKRLTPALLNKSVKRQKALLGKALKLVKPGGYVAYSTCSVLKEENEDVVAWALQKGGFELVPLGIDNLVTVPPLTSSIEHALTVCPDEHYEGFFLAVLRRM